MNSSVWAAWAAQVSKKENKLEYFLATFEGVFFILSWAKENYLFEKVL